MDYETTDYKTEEINVIKNFTLQENQEKKGIYVNASN